MTKRAKILWMDLEMTGLDASHDQILEIAAIATDWNFKEIATYETVINRSDHILENMNEWCVKQHGISGLTERVRESDITDEQAENDLLKFVRDNFGKSTPVLLAGNSIHIDRQFIDKQLPEFAATLHYRMLDVTAWKVVFEGKYRKKFSKPDEHRALGDVRGSIEELQYYLAKVK